MTLKIASLELGSPYLAAPMCGISFLPYREICRHFGAGMATTQMLAAPALIHRDEKTGRLMQLSDSERPVCIQLLGKDADELAQAAAIVQAAGADCVDLNMGCPAKKIVGSGGGSALMRDTRIAAGILRAVRKALARVPFTIKIRAGWDEENRNFIEIARIAEAEGVDAICLHARTKVAAYSGHADWDLIAQLKRAVSVPVIGNGDVRTWQDARAMMADTGCDAVMIGRASFEAPWVFRSMVEGRDYEPTPHEKKELLLAQYRGMITQFGERGGVVLMRKFVCAYTKGLPGGSVFRQRIIQLAEFAEIAELVESFFSTLSS